MFGSENIEADFDYFFLYTLMSVSPSNTHTL